MTKKAKALPLYALIGLFLITGSILISSPKDARADITNTVHDTESDRLKSGLPWRNQITQTLGTGISGTATEVGYWVHVETNPTYSLAWTIMQFADEENYNEYLTYGACASETYGCIHPNTPGSAIWYSSSTSAYNTLGAGDHYVSFPVNLTFDSTRYYLIHMTWDAYDGDSRNYSWLGSVSDEIIGAAYATSVVAPVGNDDLSFKNGIVDWSLNIEGISSAGTTPPDYTTRFITTTPANGTTTATTTTVGASMYANADDFPNYGRLKIRFTQDSYFACQNSGAVYDAIFRCAGDNVPASAIEITFDEVGDRLLTGLYDLSTTTTFGGGGEWTGVYEMQAVSRPWYFFGLLETYKTKATATSHFIVGTSSPMDIARHAVASSTANLASTTKATLNALLASTTLNIANACNPLSGFDIANCLMGVIYPGEQVMKDDIALLRNMPPWGYIFRLYDIITTTTTNDMVILTATVPPGIPGTGATLTLDFNHVLDDILNATSGPFLTAEASSTETLYEITSRYWNILVYIALGLYILRRLLGPLLIPSFHGEEWSSDTTITPEVRPGGKPTGIVHKVTRSKFKKY